MRALKTLTFLLYKNAYAFFLGCILVLAFAPFKIVFLALACPSILLIILQNTSLKQAFSRGLFFGLGLFSCGVYWIYISIHDFGHLPIWIALALTASLVFVLALFPATVCLLTQWLNKRRISYVVSFPLLWVLSELLRTWLFTGFPWLFLGYSQLTTPLSGFAPILGVYGLSYLVVFTAACITQILLDLKLNYFRAVLLGLVIIILWSAGQFLSSISWTHPLAKPIQVSLIQGNIDQDIKWSEGFLAPTLQKYYDLTKQTSPSRLVIWPEAAIPMVMQDANRFLADVEESLFEDEKGLLLGIPIKAAKDEYYNSVISLGTADGYYLKQQLVPFGEFIPFKAWFNHLFDVLGVPMASFVGSKEKQPLLSYQLINLAPFICYEIAYPMLVLQSDSKANILLTVSNDAWFGESIAQPQHLEIAQMRSLELGKPGLFLGNTGLTAVISVKGLLDMQAPPYKTYVLNASVYGYSGQTPLQKSQGYLFYLLLLIAILILLLNSKMKKRG